MIIVTGFGPYGIYHNNVSRVIAQTLELNDYEFNIVKKTLPVSWSSSIRLYKEALSESLFKPNFVILLGIQTQNHYSLEYLSWNFAFGKDINNIIKFGVIKYNLNLWLTSILDIRELYNKIKHNLDIKISYFAGFYLCNYIYFLALLLSEGQYPVLLIHIPHKEKINRGKEIISKIIRIIISNL